MSTLPHVLLAIVGATLAGAAWAGIAGVLKATTGAHEVISTIMLNYIALYAATGSSAMVGRCRHVRGGSTNPVSNTIAHSAELPVVWGAKGFQGLDIGFFIAIAALVVFWALINRTTLGYEVRAVGFNPDAAAYAGINVKKNLIRAMAISGAFAGLAGAIDMLGYLYQYGVARRPGQPGRLPRHRSGPARPQHGGRGVLSAVLFGGLLYGTTLGPELERDPARARDEPDVHHPGTHRAVHRRRAPDPLRLELA